MRRISSRWTFFMKRVFPPLWFGILGCFFLPILRGVTSGESVPLEALLFPAIMAVFGYVVLKRLVFDLADEVWDAGPELLVKNKDHEVRVALTNVVNVGYSTATSPPRVTLTLRQPTQLGKELTFMAPMSWIPFAKSPLIVDLIKRIDAARERRA